jgi:hypothetical protein
MSFLSYSIVYLCVIPSCLAARFEIVREDNKDIICEQA